MIVTDSHFDSVERVALPIDFREEGEIESLTRLISGDIAVGAWTPAGRLTLIARIIGGKRTE
ncbi:hypothetical protein GS961_15775 [Rhodococcus hoagii]|nr:hypothetical protein [Prescottella equi]